MDLYEGCGMIGRSEWKYNCTEKELSILGERLSEVLDRDDNAGPDGVYIIHSLYFDDLKYSCAWENVSGDYRRYKFRIRYYGDNYDSIFLEKKEKINSVCIKTSCPITLAEYDAIMRGEPDCFIYDTKYPVLREFGTRMLTHGFRPVVIIDYEREAFVEPVTNIRITFDRNIEASGNTDDFLKRHTGDTVLKDGTHILEVKFDNVLPSYLRYIIEAEPRTQQAFSKYYSGLKTLDIL